MVVRKLHNEGSRLAGKRLRLLQHDGGDDDGSKAHEVEHRRDPPHRGAAGEDAHHKGDDRGLCGARNHGREHCRHAAVLLVLDRLRGEDARNAAARGDDHRDEGLAGEAEAAEHAVHDKGNTGHVAAVLKEAEKHEKHEHLRDEAKDRAHAADDALDHKGDHDVGCAGCREGIRHSVRDGRNEAIVVGRIGLVCHAVDSRLEVIERDRIDRIDRLAGSSDRVAVGIEGRDHIAVRIGVVAILVRRRDVRGNDTCCICCFLEVSDRDCILVRRIFRIDCILDAVRVDACSVSSCDVARDLVGVVVVGPRLGICVVLLLARGAHEEAVAEELVVHPVRGSRADRADCDVVDKADDSDEDRDAEPAVRDDAVDLLRRRELLRCLLDAGRHHIGDPVIAVGRDDGLGVVVALLLECRDDLLAGVELGLGEAKGLDGLGIALEDLDCVPAELFRLCLALDRLRDLVQGLFDLRREALRARSRLASLGCSDGPLHELVEVLVVESGDLDHRHAKHLGKLLRVDDVTALLQKVAHVEADDDRTSCLQDLGREVEVALEIRDVDEVDHGIRTISEKIVAGDDLLRRVRGEGVDARQVDKRHVLVFSPVCHLLLDRDARPVADIAVRSGQLVEERGLAAVRVSRKTDIDAIRHFLPSLWNEYGATLCPPVSQMLLYWKQLLVGAYLLGK